VSSTAPEGSYVEVDGLRLHYLEEGAGDPVLMLHGWPTSSFLWRDIVPVVGEGSRAIALDLPGFGRSDKPLDASYSFRFYDRVLTGFLDRIGVERLGLVGHDLGGPIGLHWGAQNPERVSRLALLNTIVFSKPSLAVVGFIVVCKTPGLRSLMTSPAGIRFTMRLGIRDKSKVTDELVATYQEPFSTGDARRVLAKAGQGLHPDGLREVEEWLPRIDVPVRLLYGERDRVLPDVAKTMRKVAERVPQAELSTLPDAGHFCQEERPGEIGAELAAFFRA
jgi:pimeloyl-ACP methyl ester carboxylesterase